MESVKIEGIGEVKNWYLGNKVKKIGTSCKCIRCNNTFIAGEKEIAIAKLDDKFRPVKKVEVAIIVDADDKEYGYIIADIAVKDFKFNPDELTMAEQAILFGVNDFNTYICSECYELNKAEAEDTVYFQGNGSGTITGEYEGN